MKLREGLYAPICIVLLLILPATVATSSTAEPVTIAVAGRAMGTTWSAKFRQPPPPAPELDPAVVTARVAATLEHLESIFSTYRPASELSRLNASSSTDWCPASPELARVANASRRISELTSGAFDVTVEPLIRLWGFGPLRRLHSVPTEAQLAAARTRVDYRRLEIRLSPPALRKGSPTLSADFSSMAKGYAVDAVSVLLTSLGATDHLAQIGGDLKTSGSHPWRTAIEQPAASGVSGHITHPTPVLAQILELSGDALSTSGDGTNFTVLAGQRYGHIIDSRTGRPAASALASVSVVHASCAQSSALATALFVLGPDAGYALAIREHLAALFLIRDGNHLTRSATPEFERRVSAAPASR